MKHPRCRAELAGVIRQRQPKTCDPRPVLSVSAPRRMARIEIARRARRLLNVRFCERLVQNARAAILAGRFEDWRREFLAEYVREAAPE